MTAFAAFVAIGIDAANECFVAETDGDVLVEFRNYDPAYFDGQDILEDDDGRKYYVMKGYGNGSR